MTGSVLGFPDSFVAGRPDSSVNKPLVVGFGLVIGRPDVVGPYVTSVTKGPPVGFGVVLSPSGPGVGLITSGLPIHKA